MTKALFRKQLMEVFSWIYRDKKSGKNRSGRGIAMYIVLYLFVFGVLGAMFYQVANMLCAPLAQAGLGWLYFALMGLIAVALGVFGSVFNTYSSLYLAKDNDLLLSMPIPSGKILLIRLFGVYAMGLMYELIVMIPTLIVYFLNVPVNPVAVIFTLLIPFILSVFVLTLSCVLGWVVALVSSKLKNKNIITVVLSLAFVAGYYYVYAKAYSVLEIILANPDAIGGKVKTILYPFYHMGLAAEGNVLSMVIFTAIMAALFAVVYLVLSHSFLKIATANRGTAKVKYKEKAAKAGSSNHALLRKELRHFLGSPTYMLNCGLGIVFLPIAAVALVIKAGSVSELMFVLLQGYEDRIPLLAAAAICMISTMNDITSPSISLEGKNLWLVQAFPVSAWQVLRAKLKLHLLLTLIPAGILAVCATIVFRLELAAALLMLAVVILFVLLMALVGLALNLKLPNLHWTDETVPVKQSMSVTLALFGGWVIVLALGGLYFAVDQWIGPMGYLVCVGVLLAASAAGLFRWLRTKGSKIFETLS